MIWPVVFDSVFEFDRFDLTLGFSCQVFILRVFFCFFKSRFCLLGFLLSF